MTRIDLSQLPDIASAHHRLDVLTGQLAQALVDNGPAVVLYVQHGDPDGGEQVYTRGSDGKWRDPFGNLVGADLRDMGARLLNTWHLDGLHARVVVQAWADVALVKDHAEPARQFEPCTDGMAHEKGSGCLGGQTDPPSPVGDDGLAVLATLDLRDLLPDTIPNGYVVDLSNPIAHEQDRSRDRWQWMDSMDRWENGTGSWATMDGLRAAHRARPEWLVHGTAEVMEGVTTATPTQETQEPVPLHVLLHGHEGEPAQAQDDDEPETSRWVGMPGTLNEALVDPDASPDDQIVVARPEVYAILVNGVEAAWLRRDGDYWRPTYSGHLDRFDGEGAVEPWPIAVEGYDEGEALRLALDATATAARIMWATREVTEQARTTMREAMAKLDADRPVLARKDF